jgi:hypothetical protein
MRFRDQYDWVVLGDHPGALLSASLVARLGLSVLVLPLAPGARIAVSRSGQHLDPEPNYLLGLGKMERSSGLLAECLGRLGVLPSELERIRRAGSEPQVLTPGRRLVFSEDDEALGRELERELGPGRGEAAGLRQALAHGEGPVLSFWRQLPTRLTLASPQARKSEEPGDPEALRRSLERGVSGSGAPERAWFQRGQAASAHAGRIGDGEWSELCSGLWYGLGLGTHEDPQLSDLLQFCALGRTGASFQGGLSAYRELLLRLAKRLGAQVPLKADTRRLFIEEGRFVGVQIAKQGNMIAVGGGALGCSLAHVQEFVSLSGRQWLHHLKAAPAAHGWRFTLALTVHAEAIPPGMLARTVWKEPGAPVLELEIVNPSDYGTAPPDRRIVYLRTVMPFHPESLTIPYQRMTAARMLRQASELMPFIEYHVIRVYPDFRTDNAELSEVFGFASPDLIPENLRCINGGGVGSRSGVEGLFVATGESFPELGTLGPTVAALEATAWIAHRCGLAGPFA